MSQTTTVDPAATATTTTATGATQTATPTILTDPGKEGTAAAAGSPWREDWRDAMATREGKIDPKFRTQLDRFADPAALATSYAALQAKLSSGEFVAKLPADAKPEDIAAWRTTNGIPDKPDGYLEKLPAGLVIGEHDKPLVNQFLAAVHEQNAPPAVAHAALQAYYKIQETQAAERHAADQAFGQTTQDALRAEWGPEYTANINAIQSMVTTLAPTGVFEKIANSRMEAGGGRPLANDPDVVRFLAAVAREINPSGTVVPALGGDAVKNLDARLGELSTMMRDTSGPYWKGAKSESLQAEYRTLVDQQQRISARRAA